MTTKKISLAGFFLAILLIAAPSTTFGYYTTDQTVTKLTPTTALYTIEYTFGFAEKDVYLPASTQRGLAFDDGNEANNVGYSFTPGLGGDTNDGISAGIVLSSEPLVDGMYKVAAGHRGHFTLAVLLKLTENDPIAKYALQVDKLPFLKVSSDGARQHNELNNYELERYVTRKIGLNR